MGLAAAAVRYVHDVGAPKSRPKLLLPSAVPCLLSLFTHSLTRPTSTLQLAPLFESVDLEVTAPTTPPPINPGVTRPTTTTRAPVVGSALAGMFKTPAGGCVENFPTCCCMMGTFNVTSSSAAATLSTNLALVAGDGGVREGPGRAPLCAEIIGSVTLESTLEENDGYSFIAMGLLGRVTTSQVRLRVGTAPRTVSLRSLASTLPVTAARGRWSLCTTSAHPTLTRICICPRIWG